MWRGHLSGSSENDIILSFSNNLQGFPLNREPLLFSPVHPCFVQLERDLNTEIIGLRTTTQLSNQPSPSHSVLALALFSFQALCRHSSFFFQWEAGVLGSPKLLQERCWERTNQPQRAKRLPELQITWVQTGAQGLQSEWVLPVQMCWKGGGSLFSSSKGWLQASYRKAEYR